MAAPESVNAMVSSLEDRAGHEGTGCACERNGEHCCFRPLALFGFFLSCALS